MSNRFVSFAEVKSRVTFEALLTHYDLLAGLTRKGESVAGPCPLCKSSGKRPFSVNLQKNAWYCFAGCQSGGNILDFVARKEGVSIRRAAVLLNDWFELGLAGEPPDTEAPSQPEPPAAPAATSDALAPTANQPLTFALKNLDPEHPAFAAYGLTEATVRAFEAGYCARGLLRGRLAVPIHSATGELVAYAGVAPDPEAEDRYKLPPNFHPELEIFNLHRRRAHEAPDTGLVLTGEIVEVLRLAEHGNPLALGLFSDDLSPAQERLLVETFPEDTRLLLTSRSAMLAALAPRLARHFAVRLVDFDDALGTTASAPAASPPE